MLHTMLVVLYFAVLLALSAYGLHRLHLVLLCIRHRREIEAAKQMPHVAEQDLPRVTIQLPLFNESTVAARLRYQPSVDLATGQVVGASDDRGYNVTDRVVTMGDLYATIYKALGIDWTKEYMSPIGRPLKIANSLDDRTGQPVDELLA